MALGPRSPTQAHPTPLILLRSSPPPRSTSHNTYFLKHVVDDLLSRLHLVSHIPFVHMLN